MTDWRVRAVRHWRKDDKARKNQTIYALGDVDAGEDHGRRHTGELEAIEDGGSLARDGAKAA